MSENTFLKLVKCYLKSGYEAWAFCFCWNAALEPAKPDGLAPVIYIYSLPGLPVFSFAPADLSLKPGHSSCTEVFASPLF